MSNPHGDQQSTKPPHPLHQIAESPTHKLLLKQWLKEEDLILRRIALKESQIDAISKEITFLYCSFFALRSTLLLLLLSFASPEACCRSRVPCLISLLVSMATIWAIRYKTSTQAHSERLHQREREDGMLLMKCVEELKKKGVEFDLLKEVDALRRAKSLRAESRPAAARKSSARDFGTMVLFAVSGGFLGLTRFVLCS